MLKERIITAVVLVLAILAALFAMPVQGFQLLIVCAFAVGGWEWARMSGIGPKSAQIVYAIIIGLLSYTTMTQTGVLAGLDINLGFLQDVMGAAGLFWALALLWVIGYPGSATIWGHPVVRALMGVVILVCSSVALAYLVVQPDGQWYFIYLIGVVSAADIGAYFAGKAFGKSKLAPKVSPGKSWAGFWGGLASAALFSLAAGQFFNILGLTTIALVAVSVVTSLASVLGDLVESMVKRHAGIKDSSQLLPGHGGVMDRIDSVSAAAPVFVLLSILLRVSV